MMTMGMVAVLMLNKKLVRAFDSCNCCWDCNCCYYNLAYMDCSRRMDAEFDIDSRETVNTVADKSGMVYLTGEANKILMEWTLKCKQHQQEKKNENNEKKHSHSSEAAQIQMALITWSIEWC